MLEHLHVMLFPEVRHQLGVAVRGEAMPASFERAPRFRIIEQLAVEDDDDGAVLVGDGLVAVGEADDAETTVGQGHAVALEIALVIGSAMHDGIGHAPDGSGWNDPAAAQIDDAGDPAHAAMLPHRGRHCLLRRGSRSQ
jgi:hypothetical protein